MNKVILTVGVPGSGKTTWANKMIANDPRLARTNRDGIRRYLHPVDKWPGYKFSRKNEKEVSDFQDEVIRTRLRDGRSIIVDDTNLNSKTTARIEAVAAEFDAEVEYKDFFDVPLRKIMKQNIQREHSVPLDVIIRMYTRQMEIQDRVFKFDSSLPECILVDLDGTCADMKKGEKGRRTPFDWSRTGEDEPRPQIIELVRKYIGDCNIVFVTGRDGRALEDSTEWVKKHVMGDNPFEIFSRAAHDERCDEIIKEEMINTHIVPRYNPKFILDDRRSVTYSLRCKGLQVLQVNFGLF